VSIEQNTRTNTNFSCQFAFYANVIEASLMPSNSSRQKERKKKAGRFNRCVLISDGRERDNILRDRHVQKHFYNSVIAPASSFLFLCLGAISSLSQR
jgi:hypothetical protein